MNDLFFEARTPGSNFSAEEELIRLAEDLPDLVPDHRQRVLRAAMRAHRHRRQWARGQWKVAALLLFCVGLTLSGLYISAGTSSGPATDETADSERQYARQRRSMNSSVAALDSLANVPLPTYTDDWRLVESWLTSRSENLSHLRKALWQ